MHSFLRVNTFLNLIFGSCVQSTVHLLVVVLLNFKQRPNTIQNYYYFFLFASILQL